MPHLVLPRPLPRLGPPEPERIVDRNGRPAAEGAYVLYLMERAQRAHGNAALEVAAERANRLGVPLLVVWPTNPGAAEWTPRRAAFAVAGVREARRALAARGVPLLALATTPDEALTELQPQAAAVVVDRGYLRQDRAWRDAAAHAARATVLEVEGEVVVPVAVASTKAEVGARTLRGKLERHVERFLNPVAEVPLTHRWDEAAARAVAVTNAAWADLGDARLAGAMAPDGPPSVERWFQGGQTEARRRLRGFLDHDLARYADDRARPEMGRVSHLGPYLRFGQISPVEVALAVLDAVHAEPALEDAARAFLEELVVRRELAVNHVWYRPDYERFDSLPPWARATLLQHASDPRTPAVDEAVMEAGETHDPAWNAAMREMRETGSLHNHMRMYWGKQVLAWTPDPRRAFALAQRWNDRYFLDGYAPNGVAGVAWCFGLHDRPWPERAVFGTVRSMTAGGLARKGDPGAYVEAVARRVATSSADDRGAAGDILPG